MLFTASTVKDTLPNVRRFVAGNLAGGVDHLFVFLDAADPDVRGFLDGHPHVTCVRTDKSWWHGERPDQLNVRQRINANVVKALLSVVDGADWLFHIDADEIAQIDRAALARVPSAASTGTVTPPGSSGSWARTTSSCCRRWGSSTSRPTGPTSTATWTARRASGRGLTCG
jgi:hypothetical protein